jgi:hypothetical protein
MGGDDRSCRNDGDGWELVIINSNNVDSAASVTDSCVVATSDPTIGSTVDHGTARMAS